jgi:gas vesicle protein
MDTKKLERLERWHKQTYNNHMNWREEKMPAEREALINSLPSELREKQRQINSGYDKEHNRIQTELETLKAERAKNDALKAKILERR